MNVYKQFQSIYHILGLKSKDNVLDSLPPPEILHKSNCTHFVGGIFLIENSSNVSDNSLKQE